LAAAIENTDIVLWGKPLRRRELRLRRGGWMWGYRSHGAG
jgi:hypothetical protein